MAEKGKKEKHEEQVQFAAYKQFCDDTTVEKQRAIKEATAKMEQLVAAIQKAEADAATLAKEIAQLDEDISVYEGDKKAATEANRSFSVSSFSSRGGSFYWVQNLPSRGGQKSNFGTGMVPLLRQSRPIPYVQFWIRDCTTFSSVPTYLSSFRPRSPGEGPSTAAKTSQLGVGRSPVGIGYSFEVLVGSLEESSRS